MPNPKRLSQSAIAKTLGISRATVSLVLRGGQGAAEETKARVLAAAQSMGYRPNALIHSIRSGKSRTIGVLVQPRDSYWLEVCSGIHDRLIESEHVPIMLWQNDHLHSGMQEYALRQIHRLIDRWVDGVIFWPSFAELYKSHLHEFQNRNIPITSIHHVFDSVQSDVVESDEPQIAQLAVSHLAELGHQEILVVGFPTDMYWSKSRAEAIAGAFTKFPHIKVHHVQVDVPPPHHQETTVRIKEMLRAHPKVTAVFASIDKLAQHVYDAAAELGMKIPERLSVIGIADLDFAAFMAPPLTTIRQNGYAIGQRAAQIELERSAGLLIGPPRRFREPGSLIVRRSTGPAPKLK